MEEQYSEKMFMQDDMLSEPCVMLEMEACKNGTI
jgi:hypothetical protein